MVYTVFILSKHMSQAFNPVQQQNATALYETMYSYFIGHIFFYRSLIYVYTLYIYNSNNVYLPLAMHRSDYEQV